MTREEIISGLQFTIDMFLLDPNTGESFTEPRNDMDKITIDACKDAIELLEQEPVIDKIFCIAHPLSIMSTPELEHKAIMQIAEMLEPLCLPESEET